MRISRLFRRYTFCFILLISALCCFDAHAEVREPRTPHVAVPKGSSIEVAGNSGAATTSYPIFQPPALGPMPPVVLKYHSDFPNGLLGVGWRLEFGCIMHNPKNGVPDLYDCADNTKVGKHAPFIFLLGDQSGELLFINENEAMPRINNGLLKFSFDREKPDVWYGFAPNGVKYTFLKAHEGCKWNLCEVKDVNGNYATISYGNDNRPLKLTYGRNDNNPVKSLHWFEITFDYEDRDDIFFGYGNGFQEITKFRLSDIKVFYTSGRDDKKRLVRHTRLDYVYSHDTHRSLLTGIEEIVNGQSKGLPRVSFQYTTNFASASTLKQDRGWQKAPGLKLTYPGWILPRPSSFGELEYDHSHFVDVNNDARPDLVRFSKTKYDSEKNPFSHRNEVYYNLGSIFQHAGDQSMSIFAQNHFANVTASPAVEMLKPHWQGMYAWDENKREWSLQKNLSIPKDWLTVVDLNLDLHMDYIIGKARWYKKYDYETLKVRMGGGTNPKNTVADQLQQSLRHLCRIVATGDSGAEVIALQDLNGDDLPEVLLKPIGNYNGNWVVLHQGNGWTAYQNEYSRDGSKRVKSLISEFFNRNKGKEISYYPFAFIDLNGDHMPDFLYWYNSQLFIYMNTGIDFEFEMDYYNGSTPLTDNIIKSGIRRPWWVRGDAMADINSDGMIDFIDYNDYNYPDYDHSYHDPEAISFYLFEGGKPDLLHRQLTNDQLITEVEYLSSVEMEEMCLGKCEKQANEKINLPSTQWPVGCHAGYAKTVVKSIKVHPGSYGDPQMITNYQYMGGYYDDTEEEFRGFQKVVASTPSNRNSAEHSIFTEYYIVDSTSDDERMKMRLFQGLPIKRTKTAEDGENTTRDWVFSRTNLYGFQKFPNVNEDVYLTMLLKSSREARDPGKRYVIAATERYYPTGGSPVPLIHGTTLDTGPNYLTPALAVTGNAKPYSSSLQDEYPYIEGFSRIKGQELFQVADDSEAIKTETIYRSNVNSWLLGYPIATSFYGREKNRWILQKMQQTSYDNLNYPKGPSNKGQITEIRDIIYRWYSLYKPHPNCDCPDEDVAYVLFDYNNNGTISRMRRANRENNMTVLHDTDYLYHPENGFHVIQRSEEAGNGNRLTWLYSWDPALGVITSRVMCSNNNAQHSVNSTEQERVDYSYDSFGRLISQSAFLNGEPVELSRIQYNWNGRHPYTRLETLRDGDDRNRIKIFREEYFDALGRTKIIKRPHPNDASVTIETSHLRYDDQGRISQSMYPSIKPNQAAWVSFEFDGIGRRRKVTLPNGRTRLAVWCIKQDRNKDYRLAVIMVDEKGKGQMHLYDAFGRVVETREYKGKDIYYTHYRYDGKGNLTRFEDAEGNVQTMTYDLVGNLFSVSNLHTPSITNSAQHGTWFYCYDKLNKVTRKISPEGRITDYRHDRMGRLISVDYKDWRPYDSDADGKIGSDPEDEDFFADVRYVYDRYETLLTRHIGSPYTLGKLLQVITPQEKVWYQYDQRGRRTSETRQQDFDMTLYRTGYTYDRNNALLEVRLPSVPSEPDIIVLDPPRRWPEKNGLYEPNTSGETSGLIITNKNAYGISLHFSRLHTADKDDIVYVMKGSGSFSDPDNPKHLVATYSGLKVPFWTPMITGDTVKVCMKSNGVGEAKGFVIDRIQLYKFNWAKSHKIVYDYETTRPTRMRYGEGNFIGIGGGLRFINVVEDARYNERGQIISLTLGNGVIETYAYYGTDKLAPPHKLKKAEIRLPEGRRSWQFTYEPNGNLSSVTPQGWAPDRMFKKHFVYDELNRLTKTIFECEGRQVKNFDFAYSPGGNLIQNGSSRLIYSNPIHPHAVAKVSGSMGPKIYAYDKDGNMIRETGPRFLPNPPRLQPVYTMEWGPQNHLSGLLRHAKKDYLKLFYGVGGTRIGKALFDLNGNQRLTARYIGSHVEHRSFEDSKRNNTYVIPTFNSKGIPHI